MKFWEEDLPTPTAMLAELKEWVAHWGKWPAQSHPVSLLGCLQHADEDQFPNVKQLLCNGCTPPVESADAERSFSAFRRIKTYLWSRMSQDRLLELALMHVHHGLHVDTKEICQNTSRPTGGGCCSSPASSDRVSTEGSAWPANCTVLRNLRRRGKLVNTVQHQGTGHSLWHYIMFHVFTRQLKFYVTFSFPSLQSTQNFSTF